MPNTPRMGWPFPDRDLDPWYNALEDFVNQQDASAFAHREDRNLIVMGGGNFTFTGGLVNTLVWGGTLEVLSPIAGFLITVDAGSISMPEGNVAYLNVTRNPTQNILVSLQTSARIPSSDTAVLIAIRRNNIVYFRNGAVLQDGETLTIFSGGGASTLSSVLIAGNTSGANNIEMDANQGVLFNEGTAVSTGANQGALYVKADNGLYYRAQSDGAETRLDVTGTPTLSAVLTSGNTSGANNVEMDANQGVVFNEGTAVSTGANQGAVYVKADNQLYYRAESDGAETSLSTAESLAVTLLAGSTTGGSDVTISSGDSIISPAGGTIPILAGAGSGAAGGAIDIDSGAGDTGFNGGNITVNSGNGGAGGEGGRITIQGGNGSGNNGGSVDVLGGAGSPFGGGVFLKPGGGGQLRMETATTGSAVGLLSILGGDTSSGVGDPGGDIDILAGDNTGAGSGGDIRVIAGNGAGGGLGGTISVTGGTGSSSLAGGNITLLGGTGGSSNGAGGNAVVTGGTGGATNGVGGDVRLIPGAGTGAGADGQIQSEGVHEFQAQQVLLEIAAPTTAAGTGAVFASDGSGSLANNGLYYRRESAGTSIRLDVVEPYEVNVAAKSEVDGATTEVVVGQFAFNTSEYTNYTTFKFRGILSVSDTSLTGEVYIQNLTDGEEVTNSRQSVTGAGSDTPAKVEATLTAGAAAGNLKNTEKVYEVRITNDGTLSSDLTFLGNAFMRLEG